VSLQSELDTLSEKIVSFSEPKKVDDSTWGEFADNSVVALMVGGESTRYAAVLGGKKVQKNAHELPNGDTMIEMSIRAYRDAGIKNFVALVYHNSHSIQKRLGDGNSLGVNIIYCQDPEPPAGKGGAIRNALETGAIPQNKHLFIVNPDDVILNYPGSFVRHIGEAHIEGESKGMLATAVLGMGQPYPGTGMLVKNSQVIDTQMYPFIPVPFHAGATVFSPKALPRFRESFSLKEKSDFEQVLFPILAEEKKLWSVVIDKGVYIPVNDLKTYKQLVKLLEV
jgi:NDP-sugar pyrophosphorylase family protein